MTLQKSEIALIQLNDAIRLFIEERFLSSLTLAGAAEAIFSGLLRETGGEPGLEASYSLHREFQAVLGLNPEIHRKPKRNFFREQNLARNSLKHHDPGGPPEVSMNACDEAYWMIGRCLRGARFLNYDVEMRPAFRAWVAANARL